MSSWSRAAPPHLDSNRHRTDHEVNKSNGSRERASDRGLPDNSLLKPASRTSMNGSDYRTDSSAHGLPARPDRLPPRPPGSPPRPPSSRRYLPIGSSAHRSSAPISVPLSRPSARSRDETRTNGFAVHDRRASLVDDREDSYRPRSPPGTESTSTLEHKRNRKSSHYVPSFIPSLDDVELGQLMPPVASGSSIPKPRLPTGPEPGSLLTELAENELARSRGYHDYSSSSHDRYSHPRTTNGSSTTDRYREDDFYPPTSRPVVNGSSPLYGTAGLPQRPDMGSTRQGRSPSSDSRAARDHWSPPRSPPRRRDSVTRQRDDERDYRDRHASPERYERSPSREYRRRRDSPSPSYRRRYRDESVDSRDQYYRPRSMTRSRSRDRVPRDVRVYDDDRHDPNLVSTRRGSMIDRYRPSRRYSSESGEWSDRDDHRDGHIQDEDRRRRRPSNHSRDRDEGLLDSSREEDRSRWPVESNYLLKAETVREPIKIAFLPKESTNHAQRDKPPESDPQRMQDERSFPIRRAASPSLPPSPPPPPPAIRSPSPSNAPLSPPPLPYMPPPPPASMFRKVGRGNYLVLYDPQTAKSRKGKEQIIRYDGAAEGKPEVTVSDARLTIPEDRRSMGYGPRKNRTDGIIEVPRYSWSLSSAGPRPANAICISGLSHLTTPSDVTQKIKELRSKFSYWDGKVKATVDIDSVDIKLDNKGAYMGLCRVVLKGHYPLPSLNGETGGSTRHRQREADIKAGEIIAANRFAQHVVRVLDNTRIGPPYKVQDEKARVILDGIGGKLEKLKQAMLAGKDGKVSVEPLKLSLPASEVAVTPIPSSMPSKPSIPQPAVPQAVPVTGLNGFPLPRSTPMALANNANGTMLNFDASENPRPYAPPQHAQHAHQAPSWHHAKHQFPGQSFHPAAVQQRAAVLPAYPNMAVPTPHEPRIEPPKPPFYRKFQRYGPFHPQNPYHTNNKTLMEHHQAQMRAYEEAIKQQAKKNAFRATAGDDFIDAPFKPSRNRDGANKVGSITRATPPREVEMNLMDAPSETSSDSEAESDTGEDLIIDPKARLERHKGRVKTTVTPVKSRSAVFPDPTLGVSDQTAVKTELRKNGFPYIFVPKVAALEAKAPEKSFKQYFKGCHDVLHDQLGWYILFRKEHGASVCLKVAEMRSFPLGKINPEVRAESLPAPKPDKVEIVAVEEKKDRSENPETLLAPSQRSDSLKGEAKGDRPVPKQRKTTHRRVSSESSVSDMEMEDGTEPVRADVPPAQAELQLEMAVDPVQEVRVVDASSRSDDTEVTATVEAIEATADQLQYDATSAKGDDPVVIGQYIEKLLPEAESVLPAIDVPVESIPVKKGKRKPAAKEDKRQPPKKRAKKNQPTAASERVDAVDIDVQPMDIDLKPVIEMRPAKVDPLAIGLAKDEEDLYLLRLVVEAKAKGELPMLPEDAARLLEEAALAGESVAEPGEEEGEEGYVHPSGCARAHGYYKVEEVAKSAYLPQRNRAIVEVDQPAGNTGSNSAAATNNAVASSRSARVATRRFVQGMEHSKKAADADSDVFAFNQLRTRKKQLKFQRSPIHDWGLYAVESITAGEMVIEYVGEVIRAQVADIREKWYEKIGIGSSYLFRVDDDAVVDATKKGSMARLINHCCTPNCTAKIITINGEKKIVIYAKTNILPGDEITYDYHFPIESPENKVICLCGSPRCRGFLN